MIQTEEKDFVRDTSNRALINTNIRALQEHRLKREQAQKIEKLEQDMQCVMSVLLDIKMLITELGKK